MGGARVPMASDTTAHAQARGTSYQDRVAAPRDAVGDLADAIAQGGWGEPP